MKSNANFKTYFPRYESLWPWDQPTGKLGKLIHAPSSFAKSRKFTVDNCPMSKALKNILTRLKVNSVLDREPIVKILKSEKLQTLQNFQNQQIFNNLQIS